MSFGLDEPARVAPLGVAEQVEWAAPIADRIVQTRSALDRHGFAILKGFANSETVAVYRNQFDADSHKMSRSGGSKFSLKYADIEHHRIVEDLRGVEMLAFVNGVNQAGRRISQRPLMASDVQVGYSILSDSADAVGYHFDHLNFVNIIVPILLPATMSYLWANPNTLGTPERLMSKLGLRIVPRLMKTPLKSLFPVARYPYNTGDAIVFYGHRTLHGVLPTTFEGMRVITSANYRWPS
jgi:hypothetical protein